MEKLGKVSDVGILNFLNGNVVSNLLSKIYPVDLGYV